MIMRINIIISGGGTGGHVFPAIAIADALRERDKNINILFVGAKHKMEMDRVPAAGYSIIGLPVTGFQRRMSYKNLLFFFNLFASMLKAGKIVDNFKPDVVVGVGGYASGPVVRAAASRGVPVLIQEQNSYAGVTNRLLAKKAARICVAYEGMDKYFPAGKIVLTGNPVRRDLFDPSSSREEALTWSGIKGDRKIILVLGGSLGAGSINRAISENIEKIRQSGIELVWQTGSYGIRAAQELIAKTGYDRVHVHQFISRMDLAYALADLVISRAGAGTISELCLTGKPAILVPSPNVAEDHQTKNAKALVERGAAVLVADDLAATRLVPAALELIVDSNRLSQLKENIAEMALPDSASQIADEIFKLIKHTGD
jgi:UDP-N-acetylglucosamine--N-acetylmuramyl-(pentapeptide) pyrophosphoryl-undecaprenol N-acetylglucosamine transferase